MDAVSPQTGAQELIVAKDQEEYIPYPAALYQTEEGRVVLLSRWKLTEEEREQVLRGEDLYIGLMTDGAPVQPMYLQIGPEGWVQESIASYLCPTCREEFDTIEACREHIRGAHVKG